MKIDHVVFVDFNNRDQDGFVRLNCDGTLSDIASNSIVLREGLCLRVSDGDLLAEIVVRRPSVEGVWRGQILGSVRHSFGRS
jgi:hypothetical protein